MRQRKKGVSILCILALSAILAEGCTGAGEEDLEGIEAPDLVSLQVVTMGTEPVHGMNEFYEQLDAMTIRDLGCVVRFTYIPWGNEKQAIDSAIASGDFDIYCNGVFSNYREKAAKNAFLDLNPYLEYVPGLVGRYRQISENVLEECEINGHLYGFPQIKYAASVREGIFLYREDLCGIWGIEPIESFEDMEQYMYLAKQKQYRNYPIVTDNRIWQSVFYILGGKQYLDITFIEDMPYVVIDKDEPGKVLCRMETESFMETIRYMQKWYRDGIIDPDILGVTDNEGMRALNMMLQNNKPCETNSTLSAVTKLYIPELQETHPEWKWNFYFYCEDNPVYRCSLANDTCISVSGRCPYPERAVKFIELAHTDRAYYNLLVYGVEGIHYEMEEDRISYENIAPDAIFNGWTGLPDSFMSIPEKSSCPYWDELTRTYEAKHNLEQTTVGDHPLVGMNIDFSTLHTEELDRAWSTYMKPVLCGVTQNLEDEYQAAMDELYRAGLAEYIEEVQRQVDIYFEVRKTD